MSLKENELKFLEKFEDLINEKILNLLEWSKTNAPNSLIKAIHFIKDFPKEIKKLSSKIQPKIRVYKLKTIGYLQHYTTLIRGQITALFIYMRSPEFKNNKKEVLLVKPLNYIKFHPVKFLTQTAFLGMILFILFNITTTSQKIIVGTKKLRAPASSEHAPEIINALSIEKIKFEIPNGANSKEFLTLFAKVEIKPAHEEDLNQLEQMKHELTSEIQKIDLATISLPINHLDNEKIVKSLKQKIESYLIEHHKNIKIESINFEQVQIDRPVYYRQSERTLSFQNFDLQMFLEDTKRNKQVYLDFSVLASNRNVIIFLKENEVLLRDRFSTNVEPILPQLPVEAEGRQIIKDKIRDEMNELLKEKNIEGQILEVYLDYIITS